MARARERRLVRNVHAFANIWAAMLLAMGLGSAVLGAMFLVDVGMSLETKSGDAVTEATTQGPPPLAVLDVQAQLRPAGLYGLELVSVGPGGVPVALADVTLTLHVEDIRYVLNHGSVPGPGTFTVTPVRDADQSLAADAPLLNSGDLAHLEWELDVDPATLRAGLEIRQAQIGAGFAGQTTVTLALPPAVPQGTLVPLDILG